MRYLALILLFLVCAPVHAEGILPAGFAPGPVWLSRQGLIAGDRVELYTVVYDASERGIEGSVSFLIDGVPVGSSPFELDAGDTAVRSVRWEAVAGTHTLAARIDSAIHADTKETAPIQSLTTASTTFTVLEPEPEPEPEPVKAATTSTSNLITSIAGDGAVASVIKNVFATTENIRTSGASILSSYTEPDEEESAGQVLGVSTTTVRDGSETTPAKSSISSSIAKALTPIFAYPAIFYPFIVILLAFLVWLLARNLRNPKRRNRRY